MCLQSASVGVPNSKLARFRRGEFRDSLQMQLHDGKQLAGWGNQNDGHELSCEHGPHLTPKAERKELLFTHSFTYSFSFVQQKF